MIRRLLSEIPGLPEVMGNQYSLVMELWRDVFVDFHLQEGGSRFLVKIISG